MHRLAPRRLPSLVARRSAHTARPPKKPQFKVLLRPALFTRADIDRPLMSEPRRPATPADAEVRHVDKKPRLELADDTTPTPNATDVALNPSVEAISVDPPTDHHAPTLNVTDASLDAPVEAMFVDPAKDTSDAPADSNTSTPNVSNTTRDAPVEAMFAVPPEVARGATDAGPAKLSKKQKRKEKKRRMVEPYSNDHIISLEIKDLLGEDTVKAAEEEGTEWTSPIENQTELELTVSALSSTGHSLSIAPAPYPPWVVVTPFALPGETIRARVYRGERLYSHADLLEIVKPNPELRDDSRVKCRYFGQCAGCQYQMLSYETQLDFKRDVIVKAYKTLSGLPPSSVPTIGPTLGSPLQYGYRTKITPHFDSPVKRLQTLGAPAVAGEKPEWFNMGFNVAGTRRVMDIEECPIATPVINEKLTVVREDVLKNLAKFKNGYNLLLRESLEIPAKKASRETSPQAMSTTTDDLASSLEKKVCVTDQRGTIRERVGNMLFQYTAGSFFQNNNSVLEPLTSYVRDAIISEALPEDSRPTHLVDAYCGSGLFAIMLSPHFQKIRGIELSVDSIRAAKANATLNNIERGRLEFLAGDATKIFETVGDFPPDKTAVIIDPPRKGSDEQFINQLVRFGSQTIVYVSCNVHTQARDVGMILEKSVALYPGKKYVVESIRGFDLFPQTAHVESVAVLRLVSTQA